MSKMFSLTARLSGARCLVVACVVFAALALGEGQAHAQGRDSLLNGAAIGGAVGAGVGVAFTHATRDSDLTVGQYAYGALVFGALGAGIGLGIDALLDRASPVRPVKRRRVLIAPTMARNTRGVAVRWTW